MNRRNFLGHALGTLGLGLSGCQYLPYQGFINPCYKSGLAEHLRNHELVKSTWDGLDTKQIWDCHAHLIGTGDSLSGIWINPKMQTWLNPALYARFQFYINGSCALPEGTESLDSAFVNRLRQLHSEMPSGFRIMLLAFDYYHDVNGKVVKEYSTFYTPNNYAQTLAVRVIFAHCATLGESIDLDKGRNAPLVANLELFARLLSEKKYESLLFGDISAITQVNRSQEMIETIVTNEDWHDRLMYGSDYPLPGVMPIMAPENFVRWGYLKESEAEIISQVRQYNPLLFDIMLKRNIKIKGHRLSSRVFESRRFFVK
jgi:hypothetical protein